MFVCPVISKVLISVSWEPAVSIFSVESGDSRFETLVNTADITRRINPGD